jgi:hypothetical protein
LPAGLPKVGREGHRIDHEDRGAFLTVTIGRAEEPGGLTEIPPSDLDCSQTLQTDHDTRSKPKVAPDREAFGKNLLRLNSLTLRQSGGPEADEAAPDVLENWDEVVRFMIGLGKSDLRVLVNPERPPTWAAEPYRRFLSGDPAYVTRLLQLWEGAEPVSHTTRMHCPVRWRLDDGRLLRFTALMHVADIWQVSAWHDWHPDDPETLKALLESGGQPSA